jgi:hypothetical protein
MDTTYPELSIGVAKPRPTEAELLQEISHHSGRVDVYALLQSMESKGFLLNGVKRAVQRALDRGVLRLGTDMQLCLVHEDMAA